MALTRKFLSALGIEEAKIDEIISAHADTVNALKEQRDGYKADADKLPAVQQALDDLKASQSGDDPYKEKYEKKASQFFGNIFREAQSTKSVGTRSSLGKIG